MLANNSRGIICGKHSYEPEIFSARKVAQVPDENHVP